MKKKNVWAKKNMNNDIRWRIFYCN